MTESTAFIINRRASGLRKEENWEKTQIFLKKNFNQLANATYYLEEGLEKNIARLNNTLYYKDISDINFKRHKNFIILGGDGTIQVALQELKKLESLEEKLLGIIPCGAGDDISNELNIPNKEVAANCINNALSGNNKYTKRVDLGKAALFKEDIKEELYFLGAVGIGIDGDIIKKLDHELIPVKNIVSYFKGENNKFMQNVGKTIYNISTLYSLIMYKPRDYLVKINNKSTIYKSTIYKKVFSLNVSNVKTTGGGIKVCPDAEMDNGYFDVCIISNISKIYGISLLLKANKGQHIGKQGVGYYNKKHRIKIASIKSLDNKLFDMHLSGEYENAEKVVFKIIPKVINIIYNPYPSNNPN
ncbi:MAG: hypothetical protein KKF74_03330 [Nanoarchaeota archaeon]|nr:hypothetical protein [Nanoarchaeota archaeon]